LRTDHLPQRVVPAAVALQAGEFLAQVAQPRQVVAVILAQLVLEVGLRTFRLVGRRPRRPEDEGESEHEEWAALAHGSLPGIATPARGCGARRGPSLTPRSVCLNVAMRVGLDAGRPKAEPGHPPREHFPPPTPLDED